MKRPRKATAAEKRHMSRVAELGCIVHNGQCAGPVTIHHCGTGAGGRRDHMKVIPLCWYLHLGDEGIDGQKMSKRDWQEKYGTEAELLAKVEQQLGMP